MQRKGVILTVKNAKQEHCKTTYRIRKKFQSYQDQNMAITNDTTTDAGHQRQKEPTRYAHHIEIESDEPKYLQKVFG